MGINEDGYPEAYICREVEGPAMVADLPLLAVLCASLLGAALGCLTGMVPGLHSNNVASAVGGSPGFIVAVVALGTIGLEDEGWGLVASAAVVSCAVAHTVANVVPSVFLAIPGDDIIPSVLPGHRMAMAGMGTEALRVSVISSVTALTIALLLVIPVQAVMGPSGHIYGWITAWLGPILLTVSLVMVLAETAKDGGGGRMTGLPAGLTALSILLSAGILGHVTLFTAGFVAPLFIGLFGVPSLVVALMGRGEEVLPAEASGDGGSHRPPWGSVVRGTLAGSVVGWFPGISSAQATFLTTGETEDEGEGGIEGARRFIASVSAVNTANAVFNLVALATLLRVRSGATSAVAALTAWPTPPWEAAGVPGIHVTLLLASAAVGGIVAAPVTMSAGRWVHRVLPYLANKLALWSILVILVAVIAATSGWTGFGITVIASALGMLPPLLGLMRVHLMGVLSIPLALALILG